MHTTTDTRGAWASSVGSEQSCSKRIEWQDGFGCFTYSEKEIERVFKYIENQEEHHKKFSFKEEYLMLLKAHNIEFDPRFIFNDPI